MMKRTQSTRSVWPEYLFTPQPATSRDDISRALNGLHSGPYYLSRYLFSWDASAFFPLYIHVSKLDFVPRTPANLAPVVPIERALMLCLRELYLEKTSNEFSRARETRIPYEYWITKYKPFCEKLNGKLLEWDATARTYLSTKFPPEVLSKFFHPHPVNLPVKQLS